MKKKTSCISSPRPETCFQRGGPELDERGEEEVARALEQDLPAIDVDAHLGEAGSLEPAGRGVSVGQALDVGLEGVEAVELS